MMIWNGETITGVEKAGNTPVSILVINLSTPPQIKEFLAKMPESKHEIQSWDCHPVPGHTPSPILITVSGTVLHGSMPAKIPQTKKPGVLPRVFSQTFVLVHEPTVQPAGQPESASSDVYYVRSDTLRFVG
jgi:NTF2-related export protein 1/2